MKSLVIYDGTGLIHLQRDGAIYKIPDGGVECLEIEIPDGKILQRIDTTVTPNVPIFEDIPITDLEKTQNQLLETQAQLASLQEQILLKENGGK